MASNAVKNAISSRGLESPCRRCHYNDLPSCASVCTYVSEFQDRMLVGELRKEFCVKASLSYEGNYSFLPE